MDRDGYVSAAQAIMATRPRIGASLALPGGGRRLLELIARSREIQLEALRRLNPPPSDAAQLEQHFIRPLSASALYFREQASQASRLLMFRRAAIVLRNAPKFSAEDKEFCVQYGLLDPVEQAARARRVLKRTRFWGAVGALFGLIGLIALNVFVLFKGVTRGLHWVLPLALAGLGFTVALGVTRWRFMAKRASGPSMELGSAAGLGTDASARTFQRLGPSLAHQPSRVRAAMGRFASWRRLDQSSTNVVGSSVLPLLAAGFSIAATMTLGYGLQHQPPYPVYPIDTVTHGLPSALYMLPPAGTSVTQAQANTIAVAAWRTREIALNRYQIKVVESLEASGAKAIDQTYLEDLEYGLEPRVFSTIRPVDDLYLFVPQNSGYPMYFSAAVRSSNTGPPNSETDMMILTKSDVRSPWRISFITGSLDASDTLHLWPALASPTGYNVVTSFGNAAPTTWLGELARYYAAWKDTGHAPRPDRFQPGWMTSQKGAELTNIPQGSSNSYARHTFTFVAPPQSQQWLVGYGGFATMCGNIVEVASDTATGGGLNQNPSRYNWGAEITPGRYHQITVNYVYPVCVWSDFAHQGMFYAGGNDDSSTTSAGIH